MGKHIESTTFYLFSNPSFIKGVARLGDFGGCLDQYNSSQTEEEADSNALKRDWVMIGRDMKLALKKYDRELIKT